MAESVVCMACGQVAASWGPGPAGRPNCECTGCRSLERHRFLAALLRARPPTGGVVLDVAPMAILAKTVRSYAPRLYVRIDANPHASGRHVETCASITELPLRDGCVDLAICYHVLEHVPDDARAMAELARVLSPSGVALIQVPIVEGVPTDEDPDADVETRIRRFGQHDHVRMYGDDFEDRLHAAGLRTLRVRSTEVVGPDLSVMLGMDANENLWIASRADSAEPPLDPARLTQRTLAGVASLLAERCADLGSQNAALESRVEDLRGRNRKLKSALASKGATSPAASPLKRAVRRRVRRLRRVIRGR
jgi:SAM-dependent methyltransferase